MHLQLYNRKVDLEEKDWSCQWQQSGFAGKCPLHSFFAASAVTFPYCIEDDFQVHTVHILSFFIWLWVLKLTPSTNSSLFLQNPGNKFIPAVQKLGEKVVDATVSESAKTANTHKNKRNSDDCIAYHPIVHLTIVKYWLFPSRLRFTFAVHRSSTPPE